MLRPDERVLRDLLRSIGRAVLTGICLAIFVLVSGVGLGWGCYRLFDSPWLFLPVAFLVVVGLAHHRQRG